MAFVDENLLLNNCEEIKTKMSTDQWREEHRTLVEKIGFILNSSTFSDVTFVLCDDNNKVEFQAHSFILKLVSSVFEAMSSANFIEGSSKVIKIHHIRPEIFSLLLKFIYGQELILNNVEDAWELYKAGDQYLVTSLKDFCLEYIRPNINPQNACLTLEMSIMFQIREMEEISLGLIKECTEDVIKDEKFLLADEKSIEVILDQKALNVEEYDLFQAVQKWISSVILVKGDFKKRICETIIPKFHYLDMSVDQFINGPVKSGFLTDSQALGILGNLVTTTDLPFPDNFKNGNRSTSLRKFTGNTSELNFDGLPSNSTGLVGTCPIIFKASCDVEIEAVKVMTKLSGSSQNDKDKYDEELEIWFWDQSNLSELKSRTKFKRKVEYCSTINISLSTPMRISCNKLYRIEVFLSKLGTYKYYKLEGAYVQTGDIEFSFTKFKNDCSYTPLSSFYLKK